MQTWVEEALDDIRKSPFASDATKASLQMRWSQRESVLLGIENYVNGLQSERDMLLEESKQRSVPAEDYAEQDREIA